MCFDTDEYRIRYRLSPPIAQAFPNHAFASPTFALFEDISIHRLPADHQCFAGTRLAFSPGCIPSLNTAESFLVRQAHSRKEVSLRVTCLEESTCVSKRMILCFDGEWDRPPDPGVWGFSSQHTADRVRPQLLFDVPPATNVFQLYQSILPRGGDGRIQQKWYESGTAIPWFQRFREGSLGYGLDQTILQSYAYLAATYDPGDELYMYGFSRGAYTARSLVGLLSFAGLPSSAVLSEDHVKAVREASLVSLSNSTAVHLHECLTRMILDPDNHVLDESYRLYRTLQSDPQAARFSLSRRKGTPEIIITLLGLWDTVGPLGIPTNALRWLNEHRYNFRDTELSPIVHQACHALAIDEHRADHNATLWTSPRKAGQIIEQRWFAGAHGDLGGTYPDRELADISLAWMQRHSIAKGLAIEPGGIPEQPNMLGPIHDSFREYFGGFRKWLHPRFYRPVIQTSTDTEVLDESVHTRLLHSPTYKPKNDGLNNLLTFR